MERVIKNLPLAGRDTPCAPAPELHDDCSGIANLKADLANRNSGAPIMLGLILLATAFFAGVTVGVLICVYLRPSAV